MQSAGAAQFPAKGNENSSSWKAGDRFHKCQLTFPWDERLGWTERPFGDFKMQRPSTVMEFFPRTVRAAVYWLLRCIPYGHIAFFALYRDCDVTSNESQLIWTFPNRNRNGNCASHFPFPVNSHNCFATWEAIRHNVGKAEGDKPIRSEPSPKQNKMLLKLVEITGRCLTFESRFSLHWQAIDTICLILRRSGRLFLSLPVPDPCGDKKEKQQPPTRKGK